MNHNEPVSDRIAENVNMLSNNFPAAYVEKTKQLDNMKSTAYTFLPVSVLGFLALIAMWPDLLPIKIDLHMKWIYSIVLGGLLLFFFITGLKALFQIRLLQEQVDTEAENMDKIFVFFDETYSRHDFSTEEENKSDSPEQLYFIRLERIQTILDTQFGDLALSFREYIAEKIYQKFFPDEI